MPLWMALIIGLVLNIPQLLRTWVTRDVASFSTTTILLRIAASGCWGAYAWMRFTPLMLAASGTTLVSEGTLLLMKLWFEGVKADDV